MSLPFEQIDWDLVAEFRKIQGRVAELTRHVKDLEQRLGLRAPYGHLNPTMPVWEDDGQQR
jgi:hypothetical protein